MDRLWTPWRYSYVSGEGRPARPGVPRSLEGWPGEGSTDCPFCNMLAASAWAIESGMPAEQVDRDTGILLRSEMAFVCLNAFPYTTGHVMVIPRLHVASLLSLPESTAAELMTLGRRLEGVLRAVYRPNGINAGLNLGEAAGAGVASHLHLHMLPRWFGDTNFMTVTAETRILPEPLAVTWGKLRAELTKVATSKENFSS